ncbi:hypothetical protein HUU40_05465 [candidate division KSB1 bacterium]|nr:hypothetical protein [candidate division KSB1 bacterium]
MNNNSKPKAIDFGEIVKEMADAKTKGKNEVSIIGGVIDLQADDKPIFEDEQLAPEIKQSAEEKISKFISAWQPFFDEKAIAIWETIDCIKMPKAKDIPSVYGELMRARFFGAGGDLSLRRDGNRLYWHFIGTPRDDFPPIKNACRFWDEQEKMPEGERVEKLRLQEDVEALLWGERIVPKSGEAFWREDRVGAIDLVYPVPISDVNAQKQRAKVIYDVYWHNGQPAFVWLKKLIEVPPSKPENEEDNNNE